VPAPALRPLALLALAAPAIAVGEDPEDSQQPQLPWYAYDGDAFSALFVGAVLLDRTWFEQGARSEAAVGDLDPFNTGEVRALRLGAVGTLKFERPWTWVVGGANRAFDQGFDTNTDEHFTFFDVALGIPVGETAQVKVGKIKEPISLERIMGLAFEPFMERPMELDALFPARNVGVSFSDVALDDRATWSAGVFNDWLDSNESFDEGSSQLVARVTGLPIASEDGENLVHVGLGLRYTDARAGVVRFRGKPETFFAPDFVDTDDIAADEAWWLAAEASWNRGPLWLASEAVHTRVDSSSAQDPEFFGYHLTGSWVLTGETRRYDRRRGTFRRLVPERDVHVGGAGLWEAAVRYASLDLTDGAVVGGEMERVSVGLSWYPTAASRLALQYGWIHLDRAGESETQVLQMRWQLLLE
jgi:phosphate-selective porin OprO/OprP